jgi:hypothetical protein
MFILRGWKMRWAGDREMRVLFLAELNRWGWWVEIGEWWLDVHAHSPERRSPAVHPCWLPVLSNNCGTTIPRISPMPMLVISHDLYLQTSASAPNLSELFWCCIVFLSSVLATKRLRASDAPRANRQIIIACPCAARPSSASYPITDVCLPPIDSSHAYR